MLSNLWVTHVGPSLQIKGTCSFFPARTSTFPFPDFSFPSLPRPAYLTRRIRKEKSWKRDDLQTVQTTSAAGNKPRRATVGWQTNSTSSAPCCSSAFQPHYSILFSNFKFLDNFNLNASYFIFEKLAL